MGRKRRQRWNRKWTGRQFRDRENLKETVDILVDGWKNRGKPERKRGEREKRDGAPCINGMQSGKQRLTIY